MKKKLALVFLLLVSALAMQAQKLDPQLTLLVPRPTNRRTSSAQEQPRTLSADELRQMQQQMNITLAPDGTLQRISVMARLHPGAADPTAQLQKLGIQVVDRVGQLLILDVPADKLYELEKVEAIQRANADRAMQLTNDLARQMTQVNHLNGESPALFTATGLPLASAMPTDLTSPTDLDYYTGKGIVAGVVDKGVEFNHAAFRDAAGNQRMKAAFVPQNLVGGQGNALATVTGDDILNLTTDGDTDSHGTHTTATMSGTPISVTVKDESIDLRGMAPDADLLVSGLPSLYNSQIVSSLMKIRQYAWEHQQPAVVNLSIGAIGGFYDGTDDVSSAIDALTGGGTEPGFVTVISAGNAAADNITINKTIDSAEGVQLKTILNTYENSPYYRKLAFSFYLRDGSPFEVEFRAIDITTGKTYSLTDKETGYDLTKEVHLVEMPNGDSSARLFVFPTTLHTNGTQNIYYYSNQNTLQFYDYHDEEQQPEFDPSNLRLAVFIKGAPVGSELVMQQIGDDSQSFTADQWAADGYTAGSGDISLNVSAVTNGAISVGAYNTRPTFYSMVAGRNYTLGKTLGQISYFSSYGTDDFGYNRPDVLAPGHFIYSAYNYYDTTSANQGEENGEDKVWLVGKTAALSGEHPFYYGCMQGTSQATPCVSGIVALWLQANPQLCTNDVRRIIRLTADHDEYTDIAENTPNNDLRQAGLGKINALKGMQLIAAERQDGPLTLANAASNTDAIGNAVEEADQKPYRTVVLQDRTLYGDGSWNTLCLPFDVNIAESPLEGPGLTILQLDPARSSCTDGTLTLNFTPAGHTLTAGIPYLIRWKCEDEEDYAADPTQYDLYQPTFRYVSLTATEPIPVTTADGTVSFVGTYEPVVIPAEGDRTKLYLGSNNKLLWPSQAMNINSQRAYFQLNNGLEVGDSEVAGTHIRNIVLNLDADTDAEPTAIQALSESLTTLSRLSDDWHTLSGIRLSARPTRPGLYIHQGRKVYVP